MNVLHERLWQSGFRWGIPGGPKCCLGSELHVLRSLPRSNEARRWSNLHCARCRPPRQAESTGGMPEATSIRSWQSAGHAMRREGGWTELGN